MLTQLCSLMPSNPLCPTTGPGPNGNPNNPDYDKTLTFGEQSTDEMMFGFFNVAFDPSLNPRDLVQPRTNAASASGGGE